MENILAISSIILQYNRAIVTNARFLHEHKTHIILNYIHDDYDDLKNKICNLRVDKMLVKIFIS